MQDLIGKAVFGVIASLFMAIFYKGWKATRSPESALFARWLWALLLAAVVGQILYWIPALRFAGLDWSPLFSAVWPTYRPWYWSLIFLSAGLLFFFLLRFVTPGVIYLPLVRLVHPARSNFLLRWLFFLGAYFLLEIPFQAFLTLIQASYLAGLDDFALRIITLYNGVAGVLTLTLASLIYDAIESKPFPSNTISWRAWLAVFMAGNVVYLHTHNGWIIFLAYGFMIVWVGQRLRRVAQLPRKAARFLFWFLMDVPSLVVAFGSWMWWQKGWLTFLLTLVSILLFGFALLPGLMMRIFPIAGRQEWIALLQQNPSQKELLARLERDLVVLEREDLRKTALRKLGKLQMRLEKAEAARRARRYAAALPLLDEVINTLKGITGLIPAQKECLSKAYQSRARIRLAQGNFDAALKDASAARRHIQLGAELVGEIAEYAASQRDERQEALDYCVTYLFVRGDQPADRRFNLVQAYLEKFCMVTDASSVDQIERVRDIAARVLEVDRESPWAHRAHGQALILLGDWEQAQPALETAVRIAPQDAQALYALGKVYQHQGQNEAARRAYEQSLELNKSQPAVAHALGVLLLYAFGEAEQKAAIPWLEQAARQAPQNPAYQSDWGHALLAQGRLAEARQALEDALRLDETATKTRRSLADLLYGQNKWQAAAAHFGRLCDENPEDLDLRLRLATCLLELGEAERALDLAQTFPPDQPQASFISGRAHLRLGDYGLAIDELRALSRKQKQDGGIWYYLGCAYAWRGAEQDPASYQDALRCFENAEEVDPAYAARARLQMGHLFLRRDRLEEALRYYQSAASDREIELPAGLALARAFLANGQFDEAERSLKKLDIYDSEQARYIAGLVAEMQGDLATAERAYRQTGALGALGVVLHKLGKTREAGEVLQQARAGGEDNDRVLYYAGLCHYAADNFEQAIGEWNHLAQRHPEDKALELNLSRAWYRWGCELYRQGQYARAAEAWEPVIRLGIEGEELRPALQQLYLLAAQHAGQAGEKDRCLRRARELGAAEEACDTIRALGMLADGDPDTAYPILTKLIQLKTDDPVLNYNLGVASLSLGKTAQAEESFRRASSGGDGELDQLSSWGLVAALGATSRWKEAATVLDGLLE